jgi:hypothetical protein
VLVAGSSGREGRDATSHLAVRARRYGGVRGARRVESAASHVALRCGDPFDDRSRSRLSPTNHRLSLDRGYPRHGVFGRVGVKSLSEKPHNRPPFCRKGTCDRGRIGQHDRAAERSRNVLSAPL